MNWQRIFLLSILFLPFSFAIGPSADIDLPVVRIIFPLLGGWWLLWSFTHQNVLIDHRPRFWLLLLFLFWCASSFFWAIDQDRAMRKLLFLVMFTPAYMLAYDVWRSAYREPLIKAMVWSGVLLALIGLGMWSLQFVLGVSGTIHLLSRTTVPFFLGEAFAKVVLQYPSWLVNISGSTVLRAFGTFPDPHLFSLYLNLCLPLSVWLLIQTKQKRYLLFCFLLLTASLLSFARASYLALAASSLYLLFHSSFLSTLKRKPVWLLLAALVLGGVLLTTNPLSSRFYNSFDVKEGSTSGRLLMWEKAWQTALDHPVTGVGLGNFSRYVKPDALPREPIYAHNLFLDFAAETGIVSALLLLLLLILPIVSYWRKPSLLGKYVAVAMVIFLVHSLFETPVYSVHILPLLLVLIAMPDPEEALGKTLPSEPNSIS